MMPPVLALQGLTKRFPGVLAVSDVTLDLHAGEVHALLGENGAGKSTLIKILAGIQPADAGRILRLGAEIAIATPHDARRHGITLVPQDILMVPELSIGRNILLGQEGKLASKGRLSRAERALVQRALDRMDVQIDPEARAGDLPVPLLRLAQIARALLHPGAIMVLDEPTAVLSEADSEHLLQRLEALREAGSAILYVTHRLTEIMRLADRVTILRDGCAVGCLPRGQFDRAQLVGLMAKNILPAEAQATPPPERPRPAGTLALHVAALSAGRQVRKVSLDAASHQIIGIAGVQGSGHGKLLRLIAGVDAADAGSVTLNGTAIPPGSVRHAFASGILLVPADRRQAAIVSLLSVHENLAITPRLRSTARRFGLRRLRRERAVAQHYVQSLDIRPGNIAARLGTLSGGNQQKVALSRALEAQARVLLVEEPTQGIDVRTKAEIHRLLRGIAAAQDCIILVASSEFEELVGLADIIHVMRDGQLVHTLPGQGTTYRDILEHALP